MTHSKPDVSVVVTKTRKILLRSALQELPAQLSMQQHTMSCGHSTHAVTACIPEAQHVSHTLAIALHEAAQHMCAVSAYA